VDQDWEAIRQVGVVNPQLLAVGVVASQLLMSTEAD
jgi:hypothetical protein